MSNTALRAEAQSDVSRSRIKKFAVLKKKKNFLKRLVLFRNQPSEVSKKQRLVFTVVKMDGGRMKDKI